MRDHARLMCDMIAIAFQTNKTRVASLIISRDLSAMYYPFLDVKEGHHAASHNNNSDAYERIAHFHVSQYAYLASKLDSMKEGDGTVLDNTCLMFLSNMWIGRKHDNFRLPLVLAGGLGGTLETGRTLNYLNESEEKRKMCSLYLSLMDRFGLKAGAVRRCPDAAGAPVSKRRLHSFPILSIAFFISLMAGLHPAMAQAPAPAARPSRPTPPTRDPHTPGYVTAKELPDGTNAPADADGNFILGPTHNPAPEMTVQEGVPQGTVLTFTMESADSKIYPGIAREAQHFWHGRSHRSRQNGSHDQPSCSLHSPSGGLCSQAICSRHGRAVHRRGGRT